MTCTTGGRIAVSTCVLFCASLCIAREEIWTEVKSPNFTVISDASPKQARRAAKHLEQFRLLLKSLSLRLKVDPGSPSFVFAMRDGKGLKALLPERGKGAVEPVGIFMTGPERNLVALRLDLPDNQAYHTIYHEYVHMVMRLSFQRLPLWLNEGLAELFAFAKLSDQRASLGHPSPELIMALRKYSMMPLSTLMEVANDSPHYIETDKARIFYAQSWALTHYLMLGEKASHAKQLDAFLELLRKGVSEKDAAARAFGDIDALQQNLRKYITEDKFYYFKVPARLKVNEEEYSVRALSPAESLAARGQFLVASNRLDEAKAMLEQALQADPQNAEAHGGLGLLFLRRGNQEQARKSFETAAQLNSTSFLARFYAAQAEIQSGGDAKAAEAHLRKALEINPNFVPAYNLLAQVLLKQGARLSEALEVARKAAALEPAELTHLINVCEILLAMERYDEAAKLAERVLAIANTVGERIIAESILARIKGRQERIREARRREEAAAEELQQQAKELEERRKQFDDAEKQRRSAAAQRETAKAPPAVKEGPARRVSGRVKSVKCDYPAVMDVVLDSNGRLQRLRAKNYFQVEYSSIGAPGKEGFNPCEELTGKRVQVEFQSVTGEEFSGFIKTVGIER